MKTARIIVAAWGMAAILVFAPMEAFAGIGSALGGLAGGALGSAMGGIAWDGFGSPGSGFMSMGGGSLWRVLAE